MKRGRMAVFRYSGTEVRLDHSASGEPGTYVVYSLSRDEGTSNDYVPDGNDYFTRDWEDAVHRFRILAGDRAPLFIYGNQLLSVEDHDRGRW